MLFQLKFRCLRLRHFERRGEWDKRINQERITSHGQTVYWIICCSWNDSGIVKIFEISFYAFKWTIAVRLILSSLPHIRAHFIELSNYWMIWEASFPELFSWFLNLKNPDFFCSSVTLSERAQGTRMKF